MGTDEDYTYHSITSRTELSIHYIVHLKLTLYVNYTSI